MTTARIVRSGKNQFVLRPKEIRLEADRVEILRRGDETMQHEKPRVLARVFDIPVECPDDVFDEIGDDGPPQKRDLL